VELVAGGKIAVGYQLSAISYRRSAVSRSYRVQVHAWLMKVPFRSAIAAFNADD
jgi:hypothetical protein